MSKYILLVILGLAFTTFSDDYRSFTDKEGRTIKAKVLKVDTQTKKVTLERESKKKATVPISLFSETDQEYINAWSPTPEPAAVKSKTTQSEPKATPTTLSKSETKIIGKKYVEAINDHKSLSGFYHQSADINLANLSFYRPNKVRRVQKVQTKLLKHSEGYFIIEVRHEVTDYSSGEAREHGPYQIRVLLTPTGKIKYDTLLHPHPVEELTFMLRHYAGFTGTFPGTVNKSDNKRFISLLKECGAPPFSVDTGPSDIAMPSGKARDDMKEALEEVADWLIKNGTSVDCSSPKVFIPKTPFAVLKANLKSIKSRF